MKDGSDAIADWPLLNAMLNISSGGGAIAADANAALAAAQQTVAAQHSVAVVGLANLYAAGATTRAISLAATAVIFQSWVAFYTAAIKALAAKTPAAADAAWAVYYNAEH